MSGVQAATSTGRRSAAAARRQRRKQQILDATRELFDERGVRDAQIEDIARAVGINRAIIYRHFTGKEELFALTLVSYLDELDDALGNDDPAGTPEQRLAAMTETFVDYGLAHPAFVDCALTLMRRPGPELLEEVSEGALFRLGRSIASCLSRLTSVLTAGVQAGVFHEDDVDVLANTLYAMGLGGLQLARVGMLVAESAPGRPTVATIDAERVKQHLVAAALAMAR